MTAEAREEAALGQAPDDEGDLNNRLFFRLFQAGNIYARQALRELEVSAIQGAILGALSRKPGKGIPLSELVEYLAVSRQNLDGVLKRLEKQQYVERIEGADNRRIKVVRLTRAGQRAWDALFRSSLEFYRQGTAGVPLAEKRAFVETLGRINRAMKAIALDDGHRRPLAPRTARGAAARRRAPATES